MSKKTKESVTVWKRIAGILFGGIGGLVLGSLLLLILDICGVVTGDEETLLQFAVWTAGLCALLGFAFPRPIIAAGQLLSQLIPGI